MPFQFIESAVKLISISAAGSPDQKYRIETVPAEKIMKEIYLKSQTSPISLVTTERAHWSVWLERMEAAFMEGCAMLDSSRAKNRSLNRTKCARS